MREGKVDYLAVAYLLLCRWRRLGLLTALGILLGLVLAFTLPTEYTSTARILPPQSEPSAASLLAGQAAALGGLSGGGAALGAALGLKNPADLYIGLLRSDSIADRLVEQFHLQQVYGTHTLSAARAKLANRTTLLLEKEGLISIAVTDTNKKRAAELTNAYVHLLNSQDAELALSSAARRRQFFQAQLEMEKNALADAEVDLKKTEESHGLVQLSGQTQLLLARIAQVRAQIASRRVELQALSGAETTQNPEYQRVTSELGALEQQLMQLQQASPASGEDNLASSAVPTVGLDYVRKLREVKYHETLLDLLARQYTAARLDEARSSPQVQVVDRAEPPDHPSGPHRLLLLLCCGVLGLFVGAVQVFLADRWASLLSNEERRAQLEQILGFFRQKHSPRHA